MISVFSVCLDVSVLNMADTELYSSHSESPAETGQHAHSLTKNSLRHISDVLLLSCTVVSRAARNGYLLADVFFLCISVHHGGGCSYVGVYNESQHHKQGRNIT